MMTTEEIKRNVQDIINEEVKQLIVKDKA